jgi:hypothetical protein
VPAFPLQIEEHSSDDDKKKTINQYTVHEVLGRGAFGTVRRVTSKQEGHRVDYAMKEMSKKQLQVLWEGRKGSCTSSAILFLHTLRDAVMHNFFSHLVLQVELRCYEVGPHLNRDIYKSLVPAAKTVRHWSESDAERDGRCPEGGGWVRPFGSAASTHVLCLWIKSRLDGMGWGVGVRGYASMMSEPCGWIHGWRCRLQC